MTFYDLFKDMNHLGTDAAQIPREKKGKLCMTSLRDIFAKGTSGGSLRMGQDLC
jgi:hypothetical protein